MSLAETRLKQSSPSAASLWHGGPPRLAKSRCPLLHDSRSSLLHPTAKPSGQGSRDFAGEARRCVARRLTRGPAVQGCANPGLDGPETPRWGMGVPQPGRRATTAGQPNLRGAE
ncbi:MAG TPA: hypothetical protein VFG71_01150, partial [Nitrospiraceae bacterium]|nr:hypothetical protein [Nitrospiraceae bacterium]